MKFNILTLFPDMFPGALAEGVTGKALEKGLWDIQSIQIRDFATDNHKTVDDTPYGGGAGMVLKADVVGRAHESIQNPGKKIYLSPRGRPLTQEVVKELAQAESLTLLCGRYEGVDQRFLDAYDYEEISIGDYILSGGEIAAYVLIDAILRLIPNVLGNHETTDEESFENGLLEYPHYTRPAIWVDNQGVSREIPEVLASGHHEKITRWRLEKALEITKNNRPDLYNLYTGKKTS